MQKMSEKEALQDIQFLARRYNDLDQLNYSIKHGSLDMAIQALDEIQQYREIGTVKELARLRSDYERVLKYNDDQGKIIDRYEAIGTSDQCREAVERMKPKKPICKEMPYIEEVGFNDEYYCPTCNNYVGFFTEGMGEPEQMECCNVCGQHIAKDWSE